MKPRTLWIFLLNLQIFTISPLKIDNQLQIIKSDCYERLAIGQRLNPKAIYKTVDVKTAKDCQIVCTQEQLSCKAFSFGIDTKGNASCELSHDVVRESADLTPIGTITDTDYDLYIKKLGCTLVLDKEPEFVNPPVRPTSAPLIKPVSQKYESDKIASSDQNYNNNEEHVQTVVAVSTGPNKLVLHPVHNILIEATPNLHQTDRFDYHHNQQSSYQESYTNYNQYGYGAYRPVMQDLYRPRPPHDYLFQNQHDTNKHTSIIKNESGYESNKIHGNDSKDQHHLRPIITQSIGIHGERITSIITEIAEACFRRALAGKRVTRAFVKRALFCETVEDCQRECADEKHFICEGFNYRLDPSGRGKGECELLDLPLGRLDIGRDLYPDPDYDYYERDRNAAILNCYKGRPSGYIYDSNDYNDRRGVGYGYGRPGWGWDERDRRPSRPPRPPALRPDYDFKPRPDYDYKPRPEYDYKPQPEYDYKPRPDQWYPDDGGNRRGDFIYHQHSHSQQNYEHNYHYSYNHYLPPPPRPQPPPNQKPPYDYKSYEPYLPPNNLHTTKYYTDREKDTNYWGYKGHNYGNNYHNQPPKNYYLPPTTDDNKNWGQYGGSYGHNSGSSYYNYNHHDYWGFNKYDEKNSYGLLPPKGDYLPDYRLPPPPPPPPKDISNELLPAEPRFPPYSSIKDECSLRMATGFRLHKGIVKKFFAVPNLYECELLCFREKDFPCASYAYRYTATLSAPSDNCYLSTKNYKELDYYTDLQPDRNFDIYTMNNIKRCEKPVIATKEESECFWRVRNGQRLSQKVVRDSCNVKSVVECQIECLRATKFTCRAYSFRYGSPIIGGSIDNCQLTDWPYFELDAGIDFVPEQGFEVYDRGSYGHGCEPDHFQIRGRPFKGHPNQADQLCYIGFGTPARLLPQATRKAVNVPTELDCKHECSKFRSGTLFQCMSFSYRSNGHSNQPNCFLSDILQRDLLPKVDYIDDRDSWLFAWDNYNPECVALTETSVNNHIGKHDGFQDRYGYVYEPGNSLDTWRVYSVRGFPCRRGSRCRENHEAGFWFCELESDDVNAWDYCCRPDHQCGYSEGYPYQWCYVGPGRTQWRKCSDRYYPYSHQFNDRLDSHQSIRDPWSAPSLHRPGYRPDRPPAPPTQPPLKPSLDEYEAEFANQFLDPPKPGGFGPSRHWPVSYLHKEKPPNGTVYNDSRSLKSIDDGGLNPKYEAIQNLIDVIKSNDLNNVQYQISNESNKQDDVLFVKIPLPTNFTQKEESLNKNNKTVSNPIDVDADETGSKRSQKSLPDNNDNDKNQPTPVYRRSYITRTNVTHHGRSRIRNLTM